jgi:hypothetical protein
VATAHGGVTAAVLLPAALRKSNHGNQEYEPYRLFHANLLGDISPDEADARDGPTGNASSTDTAHVGRDS